MKSKPDVLKVVEEFDILQRRTELSLTDINKTINSLNMNVMNVRKQVNIPPLHENDHFAEQMKAFSTSASEDIQKLRDLFKQADDGYKQICARFGEDASKVTSTDFFGYIVSFITSLKSSHKHYLDVQAEEKLKKVAQDWHTITATIAQNRSSRQASPAPSGPVGPAGPVLPTGAQLQNSPKSPPSLPGNAFARSGSGEGRSIPPPFKLPSPIPTTAGARAGAASNAEKSSSGSSESRDEHDSAETKKKKSIWAKLTSWGKK